MAKIDDGGFFVAMESGAITFTPTTEQHDRMVAALMTALHSRRHIDRAELEREQCSRAILAEVLEAMRP